MKNANERTELSYALSLHSDMFKDANGFRPRGMVDGWTLEDFDREIAKLSAAIAESELTDEERLARDVAARDWLTVE